MPSEGLIVTNLAKKHITSNRNFIFLYAKKRKKRNGTTIFKDNEYLPRPLQKPLIDPKNRLASMPKDVFLSKISFFSLFFAEKFAESDFCRIFASSKQRVDSSKG